MKTQIAKASLFATFALLLHSCSNDRPRGSFDELVERAQGCYFFEDKRAFEIRGLAVLNSDGSTFTHLSESGAGRHFQWFVVDGQVTYSQEANKLVPGRQGLNHKLLYIDKLGGPEFDIIGDEVMAQYRGETNSTKSYKFRRKSCR